MNHTKLLYEDVDIKIILINGCDIITASDGAFDGEDDDVSNW